MEQVASELVSKYGLPGIVILGLLWAVISLWKQLGTCQDERFKDLKATSEVLTGNTLTLANFTAENQARARAQEAAAHALMLQTAQLESLEKEIQRFREAALQRMSS